MSPAPADRLRHGVDLCQIPRIREVMERQPRFEEAIFTDGERAYCRKRANPYVHFAARFAAKEAVLKALRRGIFGGGVDRGLKEVEVVRGEGAPRVVLHGNARKLAERGGWAVADISITHDGDLALASVILLPAAPDAAAEATT
jgi:holo-[acyl-carrier protein] synthase